MTSKSFFFADPFLKFYLLYWIYLLDNNQIFQTSKLNSLPSNTLQVYFLSWIHYFTRSFTNHWVSHRSDIIVIFDFSPLLHHQPPPFISNQSQNAVDSIPLIPLKWAPSTLFWLPQPYFIPLKLLAWNTVKLFQPFPFLKKKIHLQVFFFHSRTTITQFTCPNNSMSWHYPPNKL